MNFSLIVRRAIAPVVIVISAVPSVPVCAQQDPVRAAPNSVNSQLDSALAAAQKKDYASALGIWRQLAEQGNPIAQYNLGFMYDNGLGVLQDYAAGQLVPQGC